MQNIELQNNRSNNAKVSVIITAHNYGKYLPQCIDSVLKQRFHNYEIIVVNDGSNDNTGTILENYKDRFPLKIKIITLDGVGLSKACNIGIKASRGEYIIRLDADDYFDENILLIESNILDNEPNIHMVYPDYYHINKHGELIESVRLLRVNDEIKLLDRNPLAAGAMFRRDCYDTIGGYNEELKYQEDYDFWIRFIDKFNVYNVNLPLMYYRRHDNNMSTNFNERMVSRRYVKRKYVDERGYRKEKKIIAIIPVTANFRNMGKLAVRNLNSKPILAYTILEALNTDEIDRVFVSTEDQEIAGLARSFGAEVPFLRPFSLSETNVTIEKVIQNQLEYLDKNEGYTPDIVVKLSFNAPFRKAAHISEAINTILLYDTDSVIDVVTDLTFHWKPGKYGLQMVGFNRRFLREDKERVYKEGGSIYVSNIKTLQKQNLLGEKVGHIELSRQEAWKIDDEFSFFVAQKIGTEL